MVEDGVEYFGVERKFVLKNEVDFFKIWMKISL
jgi:hypothetical protein